MYTIDMTDTKYESIEYERRFLVRSEEWRRLVQPYSKRFADKYLSGTRLRLRVQTDSDTGRRVLKLNRKFESSSPYSRRVNRILLSAEEHRILDALEGHRLDKVRHYHHCDGRVFSVDVFEGELTGLVLCEIESADLDDLMSACAPQYAVREVTEDPFFDGGSLCQTSRSELQRILATP